MHMPYDHQKICHWANLLHSCYSGVIQFSSYYFSQFSSFFNDHTGSKFSTKVQAAGSQWCVIITHLSTVLSQLIAEPLGLASYTNVVCRFSRLFPRPVLDNQRFFSLSLRKFSRLFPHPIMDTGASSFQSLCNFSRLLPTSTLSM